MSKTKKILPKLRFPEFKNDGEWKEETLGKVYDFKSTNSLSREHLSYEKGIVKNIHYGDIHTTFSTLFDITKEKVPFIKHCVPVKIKKDNYCIEGDIIFADASEDIDDIGKSIEIINLNNEKLVSGLHTLLARQRKQKLAIGFGGYLFKSDWVRKQIQREAQGAKVLGISATRISRIRILFPQNIIEQQKIAACLSSLDELISAHSQKLELLKAHKKGLMQNMFPQEGKKVPKLRFKEFEKDGEWEHPILSKVSDVIMGSSPSSTSYNEDRIGLPLLQGNADIKNRLSAPRIYTTEITKECEVGDILLSVRAPVGTVAKSIHNACIGRGISALRAKKPNSQEYLYQWLFSYESSWGKISQGGTFDAVNSDDVRNLLVPIPSPKEQQKIASCLSSLDELITAQSQKIEQLKQHKKGLIQGLFPKINE